MCYYGLPSPPGWIPERVGLRAPASFAAAGMPSRFRDDQGPVLERPGTSKAFLRQQRTQGRASQTAPGPIPDRCPSFCEVPHGFLAHYTRQQDMLGFALIPEYIQGMGRIPTCLVDAYSGQGIRMEPHRMTDTDPGWIPPPPPSPASHLGRHLWQRFACRWSAKGGFPRNSSRLRRETPKKLELCMVLKYSPTVLRVL